MLHCSIFICEIKLNRIAYLISSISIVLFDLCARMCVRVRGMSVLGLYANMQVLYSVVAVVYACVCAHRSLRWCWKSSSINSCNFLIEAGSFRETQTLLIWPITLGSLVCTFRGWNYRWADTFTQNQHKFLGIWISVLILVQKELYLLNYLPYPVSILLNINT